MSLFSRRSRCRVVGTETCRFLSLIDWAYLGPSMTFRVQFLFRFTLITVSGDWEWRRKSKLRKIRMRVVFMYEWFKNKWMDSKRMKLVSQIIIIWKWRLIKEYKLNSGMLSLCGAGMWLSKTVPSAKIASTKHALNVKLMKLWREMDAQYPGVHVITPIILIALTNGRARKRRNAHCVRTYGQQSKLQNNDLINKFLQWSHITLKECFKLLFWGLEENCIFEKWRIWITR